MAALSLPPVTKENIYLMEDMFLELFHSTRPDAKVSLEKYRDYGVYPGTVKYALEELNLAIQNYHENKHKTPVTISDHHMDMLNESMSNGELSLLAKLLLKDKRVCKEFERKMSLPETGHVELTRRNYAIRRGCRNAHLIFRKEEAWRSMEIAARMGDGDTYFLVLSSLEPNYWRYRNTDSLIEKLQVNIVISAMVGNNQDIINDVIIRYKKHLVEDGQFTNNMINAFIISGRYDAVCNNIKPEEYYANPEIAVSNYKINGIRKMEDLLIIAGIEFYNKELLSWLQTPNFRDYFFRNSFLKTKIKMIALSFQNTQISKAIGVTGPYYDKNIYYIFGGYIDEIDKYNLKNYDLAIGAYLGFRDVYYYCLQNYVSIKKFGLDAYWKDESLSRHQVKMLYRYMFLFSNEDDVRSTLDSMMSGAVAGNNFHLIKWFLGPPSVTGHERQTKIILRLLLEAQYYQNQYTFQKLERYRYTDVDYTLTNIRLKTSNICYLMLLNQALQYIMPMK